MNEPQEVIERFSPAEATIANHQRAILRELFPNTFDGDEVNLERLAALLGKDEQSAKRERYEFNWAGKRDALRMIQTPTSATLQPDFEASSDFDETRNVFIEGENLEVLKLLYKPYFGRIRMIYIDPPYNTGSDFVYEDDFRDPLKTYQQMIGERDAEGNLLTSNSDTSGRYHSRWLSMMYPRLFLARQLLQDEGVIFVSIDDHEFAHLRQIMNEIFGEENFLATFVWKRRSGAMDSVNNVSVDHEYVVCYGKNAVSLTGVARTFKRYQNPDGDPRGPWIADNLSAAKPGGNTYYAIKDTDTGYEYWPPKGRYWPYNPKTMKRKIKEKRIIFPGTPDGSPLLKRFQQEAKSQFRPVSSWIQPPNSSNGTEENGFFALTSSINTEGTREIKALFDDKVFTYPKPVSLLKSLIEQGMPDEGDILLDFFAGSCTAAQALLEQCEADGIGRNYIMAQLPEPTPEDSIARNNGFETIAEIGLARIERVVARMRENGQGTKADLGLRVFRLRESNYRAWRGAEAPSADSYSEQLSMFADPLKEGWDERGLVFEVALKEGMSLTARIEKVLLSGRTVYRVTDDDSGAIMHICLDDDVDLALINKLELNSEDLFFCRDVAMDDTTAANLALRTRLKII